VMDRCLLPSYQLHVSAHDDGLLQVVHEILIKQLYKTFIGYIWLNQLSNTTNLWWIGVYYLVINYMFRNLMMAIFRLYMKYLLSSYTKHSLVIFGLINCRTQLICGG